MRTQQKPKILQICPSISHERISSLSYREALEREGNDVITAHTDEITLRRAGRDTYLEIAPKKVKVSDIPSISNPRNKVQQDGEAPFLLELLQKRLGKKGTGMDITEEEGELCITYPGMLIKASDIDGVCMISSWVNRQADDRALEIHKIVEDAGAIPLNSTMAMEIGRSKVAMQKAFEDHEVPVPDGIIIANAQELISKRDALTILGGGDGLIVKADSGSGGVTVFAEPDADAALRRATEIIHKGEKVVIQRDIPSGLPDNQPQWFRVLVSEGTVTGALKCIGSKREEGNSQLELYKTQEPWLDHLSEEQKELAIDAQRATGQNFSGVDVITNDAGSVALEANPDPALLPFLRLGQEDAIKSMAGDFSRRIQEKINHQIQK